MIISPPPWPNRYPWDYAWLIPIGWTVIKKGAEIVGEVCNEVRKKGQEHGKELGKKL